MAQEKYVMTEIIPEHIFAREYKAKMYLDAHGPVRGIYYITFKFEIVENVREHDVLHIIKWALKKVVEEYVHKETWPAVVLKFNVDGKYDVEFHVDIDPWSGEFFIYIKTRSAIVRAELPTTLPDQVAYFCYFTITQAKIQKVSY